MHSSMCTCIYYYEHMHMVRILDDHWRINMLMVQNLQKVTRIDILVFLVLVKQDSKDYRIPVLLLNYKALDSPVIRAPLCTPL